MSFKLSEILKIYKPEQLNEYIKMYSNYNLEEKNIFFENVSDNWTYVGNNASNFSSINMLKDSGKGLVERITNGIDAVIENEKIKNNIHNPKSLEEIIKISFPNYYHNRNDIINGDSNRQNACETNNMVVVAINDSNKSNKPTIDVLDKGCGIEGNKFSDTILSIHKGNKATTDKNYLIGAFGQGGSTSLPFSYATIILSKKEGKYYFTIIKKCMFNDMKMPSYLYFTPGGNVNNLIVDNIKHKDEYITDFLNSESGTLIRMIDVDIPHEFRKNDISKPGMLGDYINTELYNVALPVKMIENRIDYSNNIHKQDRNSFGSYFKMLTWQYAKKEFFGTITIEHHNRDYKINYYFILPNEEEDWAKDGECKNIFKQVNVHLDPIIYTVNGQYITSEKYTKLRNAGLNFLQYRLLVDINLDVLEKEKYSFFTTDRSRIQESDLTKGFLDKVIDALKNEKTIIEMNEFIASKSLSSGLNDEMLDEITKNVKGLYNKYLKAGTSITNSARGNRMTPDNEEIYLDYIDKFEITTTKNEFHKNENFKVVLTTGAKKGVNDQAKIYLFLDDKQNYSYIQSVMNGRIQYTLNELNPGVHKIQFDLYLDDDTFSRKSNVYEFIILDENCIQEDNKIKNLGLDLKIILVDDKELIVDIAKNEIDKTLSLYICLNHDLLINNVYGKTANNDEMQRIKNELIKPLVFFVLFMDDNYDKIEIEKKNQTILSFCKSYYLSKMVKN